ncbi:MAG: amidohydrolase family protein, partial [Ancrocorticia sp.]
EEVLIAATSRGAAAVGLAGVAGVLEPGYDADVVIIHGNPLANISDVKNVEEVIIGGKTFNRDYVAPFDPANRSAELTLAHKPSGLESRTLWVQRHARAAAHPHD